MLEVSVVVATFGDPGIWEPLAARACASAAIQKPSVEIVRARGDSLHDARNRGLEQVGTEWVVFLDADDVLDGRYVQAMFAGGADVRAPAVTYRRGRSSTRPRVPTVAGHRHVCEAACLPHGNWLVIGAMARTELIENVGGFRDFSMYEDWDLWLRCHLAGASFEAIPDAIYKATLRPGSRNRSGRQEARLEAHRAIARANGVPVP